MITGLGESNSEKLAGAPGFEPGVADPKGVDPASWKVAAVHSVFRFQIDRPPEDAEIHGSPSGLPSRLPSRGAQSVHRYRLETAIGNCTRSSGTGRKSCFEKSASMAVTA